MDLFREPWPPGYGASFFCAAMSDDDKIQADVTTGQSIQIERDDAFCTRMRAAIEAGLENAPIGVITTPGTKNPKYVRTESSGPLASSWAI